MKSFCSINFLLVVFSVTELPVFSNSILSVEEAAKKGFIKLTIKSKGGYTGDVIEMKVQNLTNRKLNLKIEAGRKLDSKHQNEQDILVTREQEFFVNANQPKTINVFGMCCQAHKGAPTASFAYSVGYMADSNLIKMARFIDKNKYYSNYSAQQSVWVISDNNSIGSIHDDDKEVNTMLRAFASKLTGRSIPTYEISYRSGNDGTAMGRAVTIDGVLDYTLLQTCHSTLAIYNESGEVVQLIFKNLDSDKGVYKHYFSFRTKDLPQGTYYARLNADGLLQKELKIEF